MKFIQKVSYVYALKESRPTRAAINRDYDVPYLAGYSKDGNTVYLDKDLPKTIKIDGKEIDVAEEIAIHELAEKTFEDRLGFSYDKAHRLATHSEETEVKKHDLVPKDYEKALHPFIKRAESKKKVNLPFDLDDTPYVGDPMYETWFGRKPPKK